MKTVLKMLRHGWRAWRTAWDDFLRQARYCGFWRNDLKTVSWRLLLLAHSLEKGLSLGTGDFGTRKAADLMALLDRYHRRGGDPDAYPCRMAVAAMNAYRTHRVEHGLDVSLCSGLKGASAEAGITICRREDVAADQEAFQRLCHARHSVRQFSGQPVTREEIDRAVALMGTAPTACNRQMVRLSCAMDPAKHRELAELIPGNRGFEQEPDKYLFVTADLTAFDDGEAGQWYVNGGICGAYLQLAFTACGLGSCLFQWPRDSKGDKAVRRILEIPAEEVIVCVLGVGHYRDSFPVLKAVRRDPADLIRYRL